MAFCGMCKKSSMGNSSCSMGYDLGDNAGDITAYTCLMVEDVDPILRKCWTIQNDK